MSEARRLHPPSGGMAPPVAATLPDGTRLELRPLAQSISDAHLARHPDELDRHGEAGREWCTHDNQHLLNWAALDLAGRIDLDERLRWLTRVLTSRGYPVERLVDNLRSGAAVVSRQASGTSLRALADRLSSAAESLEGPSS